MYKFINIISALIRQFLLPNPYINLFSQEVYADLFNIIIGVKKNIDIGLLSGMRLCRRYWIIWLNLQK